MAPGKHSGNAAASTAAGRASLEGQGRQWRASVRAGTVARTPEEPGMCQLSLTDGPAWVRARTLRWDRPVANDRWNQGDRRVGFVAGWHIVRRAGGSQVDAVGPERAVRRDSCRTPAVVLTWPRPRVLR